MLAVTAPEVAGVAAPAPWLSTKDAAVRVRGGTTPGPRSLYRGHVLRTEPTSSRLP